MTHFSEFGLVYTGRRLLHDSKILPYEKMCKMRAKNPCIFQQPQQSGDRYTAAGPGVSEFECTSIRCPRGTCAYWGRAGPPEQRVIDDSLSCPPTVLNQRVGHSSAYWFPSVRAIRTPHRRSAAAAARRPAPIDQPADPIPCGPAGRPSHAARCGSS